MSEAVSALGGKIWEDGIAKIQEVGPVGMITIRGDFSSERFLTGVRKVAGADIPKTTSENGTLCWMSPDELLFFCEYGQAEANVAALAKAFGEEHALAVNVSDARAVFTVSGQNARDVVSKIAPVDFSPEMFAKGSFRRSRLAQIAAAFRVLDDDAIEIICFRSNAQYVFDLLRVAAQSGSHVSYLDQAKA